MNIKGLLSLLLLAIFLFAMTAEAKGRKGLFIEVDGGFPSLMLQNPDDTKAYFEGMSFAGKLGYPVWVSDSSSFMSLGLSYKYLDLENTKVGSVTELAKHSGMGLGLQYNFNNFVIGFDYYMMMAKHYAVGAYSRQTSYNYNPYGGFVGIQIPMSGYHLGFKYSHVMGSISSSESGLQEATPLVESIYFITITIYTGTSNLGKALVGK